MPSLRADKYCKSVTAVYVYSWPHIPNSPLQNVSDFFKYSTTDSDKV